MIEIMHMGKHEPPEVRRAQLFQAAMAACAERGYHDTRMEDIAARAGLSKGSLYHHFRSKEDLFLALLEYLIDEFARVLRQPSLDESATAALRQTAEMMIAYADADPEFARGMADFYLLSVRNPAFKDRFAVHYDALISEGARVIRRGIERGEFSPDLDPELAARVFFVGGDGIGLMHIVLDQPERGARVCRAFVDIALRGFQHKERS
jgi:AcrR family transcriptional regulator